MMSSDALQCSAKRWASVRTEANVGENAEATASRREGCKIDGNPDEPSTSWTDYQDKTGLPEDLLARVESCTDLILRG